MSDDTQAADDSIEHRLRLRNLTHEDYADIEYVQNRVYGSMGGAITGKNSACK